MDDSEEKDQISGRAEREECKRSIAFKKVTSHFNTKRLSCQEETDPSTRYYWRLHEYYFNI